MLMEKAHPILKIIHKLMKKIYFLKVQLQNFPLFFTVSQYLCSKIIKLYKCNFFKIIVVNSIKILDFIVFLLI